MLMTAIDCGTILFLLEFFNEDHEGIQAMDYDGNQIGGQGHPSSDTDYDTDLEDDVIQVKQFDSGTKEQAEKSLYAYICQKVKAVPSLTLHQKLEGSRCNMRYRGLDDKEGAALTFPLQVNSSVISLDLGENRFGRAGVLHLAHMLSLNDTLRELNLSGSSSVITCETLSILCKALITNTHVVTVNLSANHITDRGSSTLAQLIKFTKRLQNLDLSYNELSSEGGLNLGPALAQNDTLVCLDLGWNHLRLAGAESIAKSLEVNTTLKRLVLAMNGFSQHGVVTIAKALTANASLVELDLTNNRINAHGAAMFGKNFNSNSTLEVLRMGSNPIKTQGSFALITFLERSSTSLRLLDLSDVMVLDQFMIVVKKIWKFNSSFRVKVGTVVNTASNKLDGSADKGIPDANPLEIVVRYMESQRMRIIDLFRTWDTDNSLSLSREEFMAGLQAVNTPLTEGQLAELIEMLDRNGDGVIDLRAKTSRSKAVKLDRQSFPNGTIMADTRDSGTVSSILQEMRELLGEGTNNHKQPTLHTVYGDMQLTDDDFDF